MKVLLLPWQKYAHVHPGLLLAFHTLYSIARGLVSCSHAALTRWDSTCLSLRFVSLSFKRKWLTKCNLGFRLNLGLQEPHNVTWWDDPVLFSMCQVAGIVVVILTKPVQKSTKHNLDKRVDWLYWETPGRKSRSAKYSLDWQFAALGYTLGSPTKKSEVVLEDLVLKSLDTVFWENLTK